MPIDALPLYHDEYTMLKIFASLGEAGITMEQAQEVIRVMQNNGILFRERMPEPEEYGD